MSATKGAGVARLDVIALSDVCDGDHAAPECLDSQCWRRDPWAARPAWADTTKPANHPEPAIELARQMSALSERCFCAGWLGGLEHTLWGVAAELRDHAFNRGTVLEFEVHWLRQLAVAAGGWVAWGDGDGLNLDGEAGKGPRLAAWPEPVQRQPSGVLIWNSPGAAWWGPNNAWTYDIVLAQQFTMSEALEHQRGSCGALRVYPLAELGPRITEEILRAQDVIAEQQKRITKLEALGGGTGQ